MSWSFALINGRLAEIYFEKTKSGVKFEGHCYVKRSEFTTKKEQKWIEEDTQRMKFVYGDEQYKRVGGEHQEILGKVEL